MLTDLHLSQIMQHASRRRRAQCLGPFNTALQAHGIVTLARAAAFVAQLAHELGELQFLEELWGPTAAQKRYEPSTNNALAKRLGNTRRGDGYRFKGRGPIQITGRDNYRRYGDLLHLDLLAQPELAATPAMPATGRRAQSATATAPVAAAPQRRFDARPDTMDFRDRMYEPTLVEVPTHLALGNHLDCNVPLLDQGREGACTGYGLATVVHYLQRKRHAPDTHPVSARMLYQMARRYDEWPGEAYEGSSARGAMKGWHKHGVCAEALYPSTPPRGRGAVHGLNAERAANALLRPLGAYLRVNHKNLVAMHAALAEVGILYATATVHAGWLRVGPEGFIPFEAQTTGGHAFAIVAYDQRGFWIQNSWGAGWGRRGMARIGYDDWLRNGTDVWVARLGAPVQLQDQATAAATQAAAAGQTTAYAVADLRAHIISVGNDGALEPGGDFGSTRAEFERLMREDIPRAMAGWDKPRILLYAHGGLVSEEAAAQRLAEYRPELLAGQVYPLAFIWRTDIWSTITNMLQDSLRRRRAEGLLSDTKDFLLDRLDGALEPLARHLGGRLMWREMKENALAASKGRGAAVLLANELKRLAERLPKEKLGALEIHVIGHSAGSILLAPLLQLLGKRGLVVRSGTLWAPACTVKLFKSHYLPALKSKKLQQLTLYALDDKTEQDDHCAHIYNKSLLYLVSNALEDRARGPFEDSGEPLLGMQRFFDPGWAEGRALAKVLDEHGVERMIAPDLEPVGSLRASGAREHGAFDDDEHTVASTFRRIIGVGVAAQVELVFNSSRNSMRVQREQIGGR